MRRYIRLEVRRLGWNLILILLDLLCELEVICSIFLEFQVCSLQKQSFKGSSYSLSSLGFLILCMVEINLV